MKKEEYTQENPEHCFEISAFHEETARWRWQHCKKNPCHLNFIPVHSFSLENLPVHHRNNLAMESIMTMADLTVRLRVRYISNERPSRYALSEQRSYTSTSTSSHVGSGIISKISPLYDKIQCLCCDSLQSQHTRQSWVVIVRTANHVIFDDSEAEKTTADLFYDGKGNTQNVRHLHGIRVQERNIKEDISDVLFVTHDSDLSRKLEQCIMRLNQLMTQKTIFEGPDIHPLSVVVSHPHGCPKQISIGGVLSKNTESEANLKCRIIPKVILAESEGDTVITSGSLKYLKGLDIIRSVKQQSNLEDSATEEAEMEVIEIQVRFPDGEISMQNLWQFSELVKETKCSLLTSGGINKDPEELKMCLILPDKQRKILEDEKLLSHYIGDICVAEALVFDEFPIGTQMLVR